MNKIKTFLLGGKKLVVIGLAVVVGLLGWYFWGQSQIPDVRYQTATVQRGTIVSSISTSGQVVSSGRLPLLSAASGQVKEVFVKNGDAVVVEQKILSITLDPSAAQKNAAAYSSYLAANAAYYSTQSTMFSKWKTYMDTATSDTYQNSDKTPNDPNRSAAQFHVAQDDWLKAQADYQNQRAVVAATWLAYQQTSPDLVAPIAGTIQDLTYVPGMLISSAVSSGIAQSQTIASIVTDSLPTITINLSEVDVNRAAERDKVTLIFDALPGKTFTGKVVGINKTGVVTSGVTNYPATIQLDSLVPEILPNMSVSANIIVATKTDVLLVPSEAVQNPNGQATIRVLRKKQVQSVNVGVGLSSDTQTEIISGLSEGDMVITGAVVKTSATPTGQSPFSTFRLGSGLGGNTGGTRTGGR